MRKKFHSLNDFYWQMFHAMRLSLRCQSQRNQTPTIQTMTTKLDLPRELEIPTADFWLSTGAITITETGEENTYYVNEFGHLFFCKNYPSNELAMERGLL